MNYITLKADNDDFHEIAKSEITNICYEILISKPEDNDLL